MIFTQKTGLVLTADIPSGHYPMAKILTMHGKADDPFNQDELAWAQFRTAEKGFRAPVPKAGFLAPGQIVSVIFADGEAFGYVNHDTDETFQRIIPTGSEKSLLKSLLIALGLIIGGGWIGGQIGGGEGVLGGTFIGFLSIISIQGAQRRKSRKQLAAGMKGLMEEAEQSWKELKGTVAPFGTQTPLNRNR